MSSDSMMRLSGTEGTDGLSKHLGIGFHVVKPPCAEARLSHRNRKTARGYKMEASPRVGSASVFTCTDNSYNGITRASSLKLTPQLKQVKMSGGTSVFNVSLN